MLLALNTSLALLPTLMLGILLHWFAVYASQVPLVFTNKHDLNKYITFLLICYYVGLFLLVFTIMVSPLLRRL